jgi:tetratricopeptide (TPR) repeat protein/tRNA A-37 threonylcarbamoyl transferase component Bud32
MYDSKHPGDNLGEDEITQSLYGVGTQLRQGDRLLGRFVVVQFLARGGMGEVYEVADEHLQGKHCALKTLRPELGADPAVHQRFEREVLLAREVNHPNVCPTYDIFRADDAHTPFLFLTMKLLRGESLRARLKRSGALDPAMVLDIARQMAAGLDAAHRAGVIHRDFKPGNVMLEGAGADVRVSITDFGLSRLYESDHTLAETGRLSGTLGYIAPEILEGRVASPSADVYAFGVVLHEMLTGNKPQEVPGTRLPGAWNAVVRGCLVSDPARRFQSAGEALAMLEPGSSSRPLSVPRHVSRRLIIEAGVAAAALGAGAAWLGWSKINALLYPLPEQRFVALLAWPPEPDASTRPLLRIVLDAIGNQLTRAEASLKKFTVIDPVALGQPAPKAMSDVVSSLGANLVLGASLHAWNSGYSLALRVFDASTGAVLRKRESQFASSEVNRLAERGSLLAAEVLDVPPDQSGLKDQDEIAKLPPAAYQSFGEAEELRSQPNDRALDAAIDKYQKVLDVEPRFALGYADLSLAYSRKFQIVKDRAFLSLAERNGSLALQYNPKSAKGVMAMAVVDLQSGKTEQAVSGFAKALQLDPGNPLILIYKARAFADLAQWREEESVYREIVRRRPNYWLAYNELGSNLFRQTRYQDAADAFAEAAAVAPRVALPLANEGAMYILLEQDQKAEDAFRRSLERAPNEIAYSNLGFIGFKRGNYQNAVEYYSKAVNLNSRNHRTWRNLGDSYAMLADSKKQKESYAKAADALGEALRVNPKPGANWATLSFYHAKLGRRSEAEADLKAAESRGLDQRAQFAKAQTLAVLGRKQEALELVLKCIDQGLSKVDVELALDLKEVRADPRYRSHISGH